MLSRLTAVLLSTCSFLLAPIADAQIFRGTAPCASRDAIIDRLTDRFDEVQMGAGLIGEAGLVEVWRSPDTGSWTILMTRPNGMTCVVATGEFWRDMPEALQKTGDPA